MLYFYYGDDMKKNGFTLVELLGVLIVLVILSMVVVTTYTKLKKDADTTIDDALAILIKDASVTYVKKNKTNIEANNVYCLTLDNIVNDNLLSNPVKNAKGEEMDLSMKIKVTVRQNNYDVTLNVSSCSEVIN